MKVSFNYIPIEMEKKDFISRKIKMIKFVKFINQINDEIVVTP